jgi:hypothetical protein
MNDIWEDLPELNEIILLDMFEEDMMEVEQQRQENCHNYNEAFFK